MDWLAIGGLLLRHLLTAAGAAAVAKGYVDESTATQVIGAIGTIAGVALSAVNKHNNGLLTKS